MSALGTLCQRAHTHTHTHTHTHISVCNFLAKSGPYLNMEGSLFQIQSVRKFGSVVCSLSKIWCNYFTCKEWTLCKFFTCKEQTVILSMPRVNVSYPYHFGVDSGVFKDDKSETEVRTNSRCQVRLLSVGSSLLACTEHKDSNVLLIILFS